MSAYENGPVAGAASAFWKLSGAPPAEHVQRTAYPPLPVDLRAVAS